jgi:hypothetical protein
LLFAGQNLLFETPKSVVEKRVCIKQPFIRVFAGVTRTGGNRLFVPDVIPICDIWYLTDYIFWRILEGNYE